MNLLTPTVLALVSTPIFAVIRPSAKEHLLKRKLIQQELPQTPGEDWTTLENGVEFLPAADLTPLAQQHMRRLTGGAYAAAGVYEQAMIDSTETYYDGTSGCSSPADSGFSSNTNPFMVCQYPSWTDYAQAWRSLGFYIDCTYSSGDGSGCQRFILWAAVSKDGWRNVSVGWTTWSDVYVVVRLFFSTYRHVIIIHSILMRSTRAMKSASTCSTIAKTTFGMTVPV